MAIEANFVAESDQQEQINDVILLFEHAMSHEPYEGTSRDPQSWHMAHGTWHLAPGTWHMAHGIGSSGGHAGERVLFIGTEVLDSVISTLRCIRHLAPPGSTWVRAYLARLGSL
jgi:hypothetical protein